MMKKITIFLICCFAIATSSLAQEEQMIQEEQMQLQPLQEQEEAEVFTFLEDRDFSRWSIFASAGISIFDGDAIQKYNEVIPQSLSEFAFDAGVEVALNPRFGLGLAYNYLPIGADASNIEFDGKVHFAKAYMSISLSNLFSYYRLHQRWNIYTDLGIGVGFYNSKSVRTSAERGPYDLKNGRAMGLAFGLGAEYNISRSWAIGLSAEYRVFNKDNMEAARHIQGNSNDGVLSAMLGLRWKLGGVRRVHARNTSTAFYEGVMIPMQSGGNIDPKRLDDVERTVAAIVASNCVNCIPQSEIDRLEAKIDALTNVGTQTQIVKEVVVEGQQNVPSIFFAFDSYALDQKARDILKEVALMMMISPELKVEIRGYADNEGSEGYNLTLSTNRATAAQQVLIHLYQIDPSRITINGEGKIHNPVQRYPLNRRCDFIFTK